ncbi:protein BIC1-like [Diospyros lotus]|uniref:protein BIC1-like n=1 Tax=Diospyros lotus TaxID=55363 RepID=UPI0022592FE2|nr:protein BIC1-like [Diospyros lotus]
MTLQGCVEPKGIHPESLCDQTGPQSPSSEPHRPGTDRKAALKRAPAAQPEAAPSTTGDGGAVVEVNGRERLKRHRVEVAGRVWIPDIWGQEELLKDWIDCTVFDASLVSSSILSARSALVQERGIRRATPSRLRIENRC